LEIIGGEERMTQQLSEMKICTLEVAKTKLIKKLVDQGFLLKQVFPINNYRYVIIEFQERKIMLMYKREPFKTFGLRFRAYGKTGAGDSINKEDLQLALRYGVTDLYFIYTSGVCYEISIMDFLMNCLKWNNDEGKEIRSIGLNELKRKYDLK